MTIRPQINWIVFDLGGVMIRLANGWQSACEEAGVTYRHFERSEAVLAAWHELEESLGSGMIAPEQYYTGVRDLLDGIYTADEIRLTYQAIIREEFPGIHETVIALNDAGLNTACLSNTCAPHWVDLTNPAIYPGIGKLHARHASHLFGLTKPNHAIYRRFEQETGATPAGILFFDDRPDNVQAAQECGWNAVRIGEEIPAVAQIHAALGDHGVRIDVE